MWFEPAMHFASEASKYAKLNEVEPDKEMNDHSDSVTSLVAVVVIIWAVGCFCGTLISASIILSLLQTP